MLKRMLKKALRCVGIRRPREYRDLAAYYLQQARKAKSPRFFLLCLLNLRVPMTVKIYGVRVIIRAATPDLQVALSCLGGEFDQLCATIPTLRHRLVIDAGGYIGTAAIAFARRYPTATIVTLEPNTANYEVLIKNTASWPNIVAKRAALTPEAGSAILNDRGTGNWGFTLIQKAADCATSPIERVPCITVDQLLKEIGVDGIDIFKIDIEGGEHAPLSSNNGWIGKTTGICIELHDQIRPGCSEVWRAATAGRTNFALGGEKHVSLMHT
jgi:FkbM family methyltransferase